MRCSCQRFCISITQRFLVADDVPPFSESFGCVCRKNSNFLRLWLCFRWKIFT